MKLSEIRSMDLVSLGDKVKELKAELAKEKAMVAGGTRPEKPGKIRTLRKTIARILTVANEKERQQKKKELNQKNEVIKRK